jgi:hypothetical protein
MLKAQVQHYSHFICMMRGWISTFIIFSISFTQYLKGDNAIIAYGNNGDGKLTPILGGPFLTGGSGIGNPEQIEGPSNSDNEIRITNNKQFLLAVNSGSNTIAVFNINIDGSLWLL